MSGRDGQQDPAEDCYPYPDRTRGNGMRREGDVQEQSEESELLAQSCERAVVRVGPQQVCPERTRVGLKIGPNVAGNRPAVLKIGALTPLFTRVSVSLGVLWSGKGDVDKQHHRLFPLLAATIKATR